MSTICFDTETTGLDTSYDEVVQLSIADADTGEEILNQYFRPCDELMERGWDEAAAVTGITPGTVADCPTFDDPYDGDPGYLWRDYVRDIFDSADVIIGYHVAYDVAMMEREGFDMSPYTYEDPMYAYACWYWSGIKNPVYVTKKGREMSPWLRWKDDGFGHKGQWIPKNLTKAAEDFGIVDFGAHDSMNDVNATIGVWHAMRDKQAELDDSPFAYDGYGEPMCDSDYEYIHLNEDGEQMLDPNGYALRYVRQYSRAQLAVIDS